MFGSDLLVFLLEVVDSFFLVGDSFLSLANLFLVPLSCHVMSCHVSYYTGTKETRVS